jgi:hypothetical protein
MAMKIHVGLQLGDRIESVGGCDSHEAAAMLQVRPPCVPLNAQLVACSNSVLGHHALPIA